MTQKSATRTRLSSHADILYLSQWLTTVGGLITVTAAPALAQSISVDGSTNTLLNNATSCSGACTITGGLRTTTDTPSLFHSFSNFNVDSGAIVTFEDPGVSSIFSRVTGNSLTNIDGTLKVDGPANLYLLNPNGIIFGSGASLDLSGSFLSSTADSILFEENQEFSASSQNSPSLLSVSVPLGLQFGNAANPISIAGDGHALTYDPRSFTVSRGRPSTGLIAAEGQTIALIGGNVSLDGGNLLALGGSVEIGSVAAGSRVNLSADESRFNISYPDAISFQDISLQQRSSIDVSGDDAGSVRLEGRNVRIEESSAIFAKVEKSGNGEIIINASDSISVTGEIPATAPTMITGASIEIGNGAIGDGNSLIALNANQVGLFQAGQIGIGMAGEGSAGSLLVSADTVVADGGDENSPSSLYAAVLPAYRIGGAAIGQGGDLTINAEQLNVTNGAQLSTSTFDGGNAGNLTVNAQDIRVVGRNTLNVKASSSIRSISEIPPLNFLLPRFPSVAEGSGDSGTVTLNAARILITDAAQVGVGTISNNSGGSLVVNASESIELIGGDSNGRSGLFASALGDRRIPPSVASTGIGGSIDINTRQLTVLDGATINVSTVPSEAQTAGNGIPGQGTAGDININATDINIKNGGFITANTSAGDRANITIQSDSLVLREGGSITTNATNAATGGDIKIDTEALIAFENSDITANATDSFGGRIVVTSPTIIGTAYREALTADSDITATSDLGPAFSGSVELNSPDIDPTDGTVELPAGLNAEAQIIAACEKLDSNTFIATGRGGLPEGSGQVVSNQALWNDFRLLEAESTALIEQDVEISLISQQEAQLDYHSNGDSTNSDSTNNDSINNGSINNDSISHPSSIVEAQNWTLDDDGNVILGTHRTLLASSGSSPQCLAALHR